MKRLARLASAPLTLSLSALVFVGCASDSVSFGERVADDPAKGGASGQAGGAGASGGKAGLAGASGTAGAGARGGSPGTGGASSGAGGVAGAAGGAGLAGGSGSAGAAGNAGGSGEAGTSGASGNAGAAGNAGASGAAGVGGSGPTDPLGVHPWPMVHRTAGNQPKSPYAYGGSSLWLRWATRIVPTGEAVPSARPLIDAEGKIYVLSTTGVHVVSSEGKEIVKISSQKPRGIALTAKSEIIVSDDAGITAYGPAPAAGVIWNVAPQKPLGQWHDSAPIIAPDGHIFVVDAGQDVLGIDGAGGVLWRKQGLTAGPGINTPALGPDGQVYVSGTTEYVISYDPASGAETPRWTTGGWLGPVFVDAARGRLGVSGREKLSFLAPTAAQDNSLTQLDADIGAKGTLPVDIRRDEASPLEDRVWAVGGLAKGERAFLAIFDGGIASNTMLVGAPNPHDGENASTVRSNPAAFANEVPIFAHPDGGLYVRAPDSPTRTLSRFRSGARRAPALAASPSIGPGGDVYFFEEDGLLYRVGTKDNPCPDVDVEGAFLNSAAIGETLVFQPEGTAEGATPSSSPIVFSGSVSAALRPESNTKRYFFDVPPLLVPEVGETQPILFTGPIANDKLVCSRVTPALQSYGSRPTVTAVRPANGPADALPVLGQEILVDGTGFVVDAPNELVVSLSYGGGMSGGARLRLDGSVLTFRPLLLVPTQPLITTDQQLRVALPDVAKDPVSANMIAELAEVPMVLTIASKHSNTGSQSFVFQVRTK